MNFISLFIAWRYARARHGSRFLNFITLFSIGGILLGVCALIIVLSVMNGFEDRLKQSILGTIPHILLDNTASNEVATHHLEAVVGVTPIVISQAMIQSKRDLKAVSLQGIEPVEAMTLNPIANNMRYGQLSSLVSGAYHVILGRRIAQQLQVNVGDKIRLISAQRSIYTPLGPIPSQRSFIVTGLFEMGSEADNRIALIHIDDAKRLLRQPRNHPSSLRLYLDNAFADERIIEQLALSDTAIITSWRQEYGQLFAAVKMEKNMMWLMLSLIIAVAAFNIISALVILVTEKTTAIAILSTLGLPPTKLALIFVCQGTLNGVVGTLIGTALGLLITVNLNELLNFLNVQMIINPLDPSAGLPILINPEQIVMLVLGTVLLTLLSTLYPSLKAGAIEPAKALRHD